MTPATFVPTTFSDLAISSLAVVDSLGQITNQGNAITLRSAVIAANAAGGTNTILLNAATYQLTIAGDADDRNFVSFNPLIGDLNADNDGLTIQGASAATTTIQQTTGADRILTDNSTAALGFDIAISGITFRGGRDNASIGGGALFLGSEQGTATISNCIFIDNQANGGAGLGGGAICSTGGDLSLVNCSFGGAGASANTSSVSGGAVRFDSSDFVNAGPYTSVLTVTGCTFTNNSAASNSAGGGAIVVSNSNNTTAIANIAASTFAGNRNTAGGGGAIFLESGSLNVARSTFVSNQALAAGHGGAIAATGGTATSVSFSRFVGNTAATPANGNVLAFGTGGGSFTAHSNWWASNTGPAANDRDTTGAAIAVSNFLQLRISASATALTAGGTSSLTADFLTDSASNSVALANLTALVGLPISFGGVLGSISGAQTTVQAAGSATATYTAGATAGAGSASATVDGASASVAISIRPTVTLSTANLPANSNTITIAGTGFSTTPANNSVTFNNGAVGSATSASPTSLTVTFSTQPTSAGSLTAVVTTNTVSSGAAVQVATVSPVVTLNTATLLATANTITIAGFGFDPVAGNNTITFNNGAVGSATSASPTSLTVTFSTQPTSAGSLTAVVTSNTISSGPAVQVATVSPVVTLNTATLLATANTITIAGFGFDPIAANNTITFNNGAVGSATTASPTSLTVTFSTQPTSAGSLTAVVTTNTVSSGAAVQVATVTPVVTASTTLISPSATTVTINGFGFAAANANNSVAFNLGATGNVTSSSPTQLVVTFTAQPAPGNLTAVVTSNTVSSGAAVQVATVSSSLSINNVTLAEGDTGATSFTFTVTVDFASADGTATVGDSDYVANSGTVTFAPGQTTQTVTIFVNGDTKYEADETFAVNLSAPTNATIGDGAGLGTITNDDPVPSLSIDDVTLSEGDAGTTSFTFTVTLDAASAQTVTVDFVSADGTATIADGDYAPNSGTLTFAPGVTTQTVTVLVFGDITNEADETFIVILSSPTNATISDGAGLGTITNDDAVPSLSIDDVTLAEGDAGTTAFTFTVTLGAVSGQAVTVDFATAPGNAVAGSDYLANSGTVTFAPGQTTQTVTVLVNGDTTNEANETFAVNLSAPTNATIGDGAGLGTITNDDPVPSLSISDVTLAEGDAGPTSFTFTVTLDAVSGQTVTVNYASADGTASIGDGDYVANSGTVTFNPGETTKSITVLVNGDITNEADETFAVNLSAPNNATIGDGAGLGTITNDDPVPSLSIDDVTLAEGDAGTTPFTFTVTLDAVSGQTVTVNFDTAPGSAAAGSDYAPNSGTLTFAPGGDHPDRHRPRHRRHHQRSQRDLHRQPVRTDQRHHHRRRRCRHHHQRRPGSQRLHRRCDVG